jgi:pyruvate kinase
MSAKEPHPKRLTKIVCTIGPSCSKEQQIRDLVQSGMALARVNLAHGSAEQQLPLIQALLRIRAEHPTGLGILLDIPGTQVRTGDVPAAIRIHEGQEVYFGASSAAKHEGSPFVVVDYAAFAKDARGTKRLLIDNGEISFDIVSVENNGTVRARALQDGEIGSRRHVNMPGTSISLPTFSASDWKDMDSAMHLQVDFLALSFVRSAQDVEEARRYLHKRKSTIGIIAKIETREAVEDLPAIVRAADGIMVARGDLGAELPFEEVPVIQDEAVALCRDNGKPVIVATHMLESMIEHPLPTRAEVTDVAHAATIRTDATMLSGETASGKHPLVAVEAMHRILIATEAHLARFPRQGSDAIRSPGEARAEAAVSLAESTNAAAIVVMTKTGQSAQDVSKFRPRVPIIAVTDAASAQGRLSVHYGVFPLVSAFQGEFEDSVGRGIGKAMSAGLLFGGQEIILVTGTKIKNGTTISVQARRVG